MSDQARITSTGDVVAQGKRVFVQSVCFEHTAAATCELKTGGSSGTSKIILRLGAAGSTTWVSGDPRGVAFADGVHGTLSAGTVAVEFS